MNAADRSKGKKSAGTASNASSGGEGSFGALFEQTTTARTGQRRYHTGESLEVTVVVIARDSVFADLGGKQEGYFERAELVDPSGRLRVEVGSRVTAVVKGVDGNGQVRLSPVTVKTAEGDVTAAMPATSDAPVLVEGARVRGKITGIERYGVFVQIAGGQGRGSRGLVPTAETATPRGADLKKHFTVGQDVEAKIVRIDEEGKVRLSFSALAEDQDRAELEAYRAQQVAPSKGEGDKPGQKAGFGTFADLLSKKSKR